MAYAEQRKYLTPLLTTLALMCVASAAVANNNHNTLPYGCDEPALQSHKPSGCLKQPISYYVEDTLHNGFLYTLDIIGDNKPNQYWLRTHEDQLVPLGAFTQSGTLELMPCLFRQLRFDGNLIGSPETYWIGHFGTYVYELKNKKLYGTLRADYPFKGNITTPDGAQCRGDFGYAEGILTWPEARKLCEGTYKDEASPSKPRLRQMRHYIHTAGNYYLCEMEDANIGDAPSKVTHFYRVDLEKYATPRIVLMRTATHAQQDKWKFH